MRLIFAFLIALSITDARSFSDSPNLPQCGESEFGYLSANELFSYSGNAISIINFEDKDNIYISKTINLPAGLELRHSKPQKENNSLARQWPNARPLERRRLAIRHSDLTTYSVIDIDNISDISTAWFEGLTLADAHTVELESFTYPAGRPGTLPIPALRGEPTQAIREFNSNISGVLYPLRELPVTKSYVALKILRAGADAPVVEVLNLNSGEYISYPGRWKDVNWFALGSDGAPVARLINTTPGRKELQVKSGNMWEEVYSLGLHEVRFLHQATDSVGGINIWFLVNEVHGGSYLLKINSYTGEFMELARTNGGLSRPAISADGRELLWVHTVSAQSEGLEFFGSNSRQLYEDINPDNSALMSIAFWGPDGNSLIKRDILGKLDDEALSLIIFGEADNGVKLLPLCH